MFPYRGTTNQRGLTRSDLGRFNVCTDEGYVFYGYGPTSYRTGTRNGNNTSGIIYMQLLVIFFLIFRVAINSNITRIDPHRFAPSNDRHVVIFAS